MRKTRRDIRVGIVGGGFGGIAVAVRLKKAGFESFTIFEREAGPGGTWWINDYPGCEIDVTSDIYSYSYSGTRWSRTHVRQPELLAYIHHVVDEYDLQRHFRFNTPVAALQWDDGQYWHLTTASGERHEFDVVVSAVGFLSNPRIPTWAGMDEFQGTAFHTAHWDHDYDFEGKTVAVVGVGSTAAQVVPTIAPRVKQMYVFQREPGWVLPKGDRDYTPDEEDRLAQPLRYRWRRYSTFVAFERSQLGGAIYRPGTRPHIEAERVARELIDSVFADRPDLRAAVTPDYVFSGKRRVVSDDFYPALLRDNVELVPRAVESLTATGIVDSDGVERQVDAVIMATGFTASQYLSSIEVTGRDAHDLHEVWRDGAFAFLGMTVPGFPNFYMLYGPNTNGGAPVTYFHERQAKYVVDDVKRLTRPGVASLEVKPLYCDLYNAWLQNKMRGTAWDDPGAKSYFRASSGKIVTQWPDGMVKYTSLLWALRRPSAVTRRFD